MLRLFRRCPDVAAISIHFFFTATCTVRGVAPPLLPLCKVPVEAAAPLSIDHTRWPCRGGAAIAAVSSVPVFQSPMWPAPPGRGEARPQHSTCQIIASKQIIVLPGCSLSELRIIGYIIILKLQGGCQIAPRLGTHKAKNMILKIYVNFRNRNTEV